MTSAIVLPPLTTWAEQHLTSLLQAGTQGDFDQVFDSFISQDVDITFNGSKLTRDQYKQQLSGEELLERSVTVNFEDIVQAPELNTQATQDSGLVGIFYNAQFIEKILIFGAPASHTANSSFNITVAQDKRVPLPPRGIRGDVDRRRVVALNQVLVDQAPPITVPGLMPVPQ